MLGQAGVRGRRFRPLDRPRATRSARSSSASTRATPCACRRVGTGFNASAASALYKRLEPTRLHQARSPSRSAPPMHGRFVSSGPSWSRKSTSAAGRRTDCLRQASFKGLRDDKPAREIVRETPRPNRAPEAEHSPIALTHPDRLYGPTTASPNRALPTITPRSGRAWRRSSSDGRLPCCGARTGSEGRRSSRSTPGKGSAPQRRAGQRPQGDGRAADQHPRSRRLDGARADRRRWRSIPGDPPSPTGSGRTRS